MTGTHIAHRMMRIGEVAELVGTTPRTIRYYEEIGLLDAETERQQGQHRLYSEADVKRLTEIVRTKELLGLSLDQLKTLVDAETRRADVRREFGETDDPARKRELLTESEAHIVMQLELVRERLSELTALERELVERLERVEGLRGRIG